MRADRPEFDGYLDALVDESVAVSWVILGNEELAIEATIRTVVQAHESWHEWSEDRPVRNVRQATVRQALALARQPERGGGIHPSSGTAIDSAEQPSETTRPADALTRALRELAPADRALIAATCLQDASSADAYASVDGAQVQPLERTQDTIRRRLDEQRIYSPVEILMRDAAAELSGAGVVDQALHRIRRSTVRRRVLLAGGVGGIAAAIAVAARVGGEQAWGPADDGSASASGSRLTLHTLPAASDFADLPVLPDALVDTAIPATWGLSDITDAVPLSQMGTAPGSIRALFLYPDPEGGHLPVLHIPSHDPPYVALDTLSLPHPQDERLLRSTRLIDDDRRRVALLSAHSVTFVEPATGVSTSVDLVEAEAVDGGWSTGGRWFMVVTAVQTLRVDPVAQTFTPVGGAAGYGRKKLGMVSDTLSLFEIDSNGVVNGGREPPGPIGAVLGSTTVNTQGWAAASVTISNPGLVGGATRGLYAVSWDVSARSSLLVPARQDLNEASESSSATALGWAPGAVLLFGLSATDEAGQILGWNVIDGSIYRVARLIAPPGSYWGPLPSLSP
ncbi:MAG: hypothetical protein KBB39_04920 [Phycicoccus sp.]|nr:hypothetical protein [Phycicoccus sp.]